MLADKTLREREELSNRQAQCLALASEGMTSKEIGRKIGISPSTVDNHLRIAAAKLQVRNRRQAIRRLTVSSDFTETLVEAVSDPPYLPGRVTAKAGLFPPLGGSVNTLSRSERLSMVVRIALAGTMALAAITTTILGIVSILSR